MLVYDMDRREVRLECVEAPGDQKPHKRVIFSNVLGLTEQMFDDALDDDLMDSVIGINLMPDGAYCLHSQKRELIIHVGSDPVAEVVV